MGQMIIPFKVRHKRLSPKSYEFVHRFFWFKIDLDQNNKSNSKLLSFNRPNLYSFYDSDHFSLGNPSARENFIQFAQSKGLKQKIKNVTIYTQVRFLGYVFNPVSFILLKDVDDKLHGIIEIGNTFKEKKPYFVSHEHFDNNGFTFKTIKHFYVSPFIKHDSFMNFVFKIKDEKISIYIDDVEDKKRVLQVWFDGNEKPLSTFELIKQTVFVPFVTLQFIILIHIHAFILWFKNIKYLKKSEFPELQQGVYFARNKNND